MCTLRFLRLSIVIMLAAWAGTTATAQQASRLIADHVVRDANTLVADGNVIIFLDGDRLSAQRITYSHQTGRMVVDGPIVVRTADGTVITADQGDLYRPGAPDILRNLRALVADQWQVTARQAQRQGPLTELSQVAATTCATCPGRAPLWEIRAHHITRDSQQRRIWIDQAHLRIRGTPVLPLPAMSIPEPSVARATGFLMPSFAANGANSYAKLPYFIALDDQRDVTLTPWVGRNTGALQMRYRQAIGHAAGHGLVTLDTIAAARTSQAQGAQGGTRGIWARAGLIYELGAEWELSADLEAASRPAFLAPLGIDTRAHLDSAITLRQILPRRLISTTTTHYEPLSGTSTALNHPQWVTTSQAHLRQTAPGGVILAAAQFDAHWRSAQRAAAGQISQARIGVQLGYRGRALFGPGLELSGQVDLGTDSYWTKAVGAAARAGTRHQASGRLTLAWPIQIGSDHRHSVTPRVSLILREVSGYRPAAQDSSPAHFSVHDLHHSSTSAGEDRANRDLRAAWGVDWRQQGAEGSSYLSIGQAQDLRSGAPGDLLLGLGGTGANWQIDALSAVDLRGGMRAFDLRGHWSDAGHSVTGALAYQRADPTVGRRQDLSELHLSSAWQLTQTARIDLGGRYDLARRQAVSGDIALNWRNECVRMRLSASHKFASSFNVTPNTSFGVDLGLEGFSSGSRSYRAASCTN